MNAKQELLEELKDKATVKCISIKDVRSWNNSKTIVLKVGYTQKDYEEFLEKLNYEYDRGYGSQELEGIVWLSDGTWIDRGEYDGSEWWIYQKCPDITDDLI